MRTRRYLTPVVEKVLAAGKTAFIGGPRQVGKTTLALPLLGRAARDRSAVADPGARFENLVASHLLKYCYWIEDTEGFRMELRHLRDTDRREVDFVVLRGGKPQFAVECEAGERAIGPAVRYCAERTPIPWFFQVHPGDRHYASGKVTVLPFTTFCTELNLP